MVYRRAFTFSKYTENVNTLYMVIIFGYRVVFVNSSSKHASSGDGSNEGHNLCFYVQIKEFLYFYWIVPLSNF